MENNETSNGNGTRMPERRVSLEEARKLVARSDYWRPDTMPTQVQLRNVHEMLKAGTNKWGRVQIYVPALLEDGRHVTFAMSRRCMSQLLELVDREGIDQELLEDQVLEVSKTGRGLETSYSWKVPDRGLGAFAPDSSSKGPGPLVVGQKTTTQGDPSPQGKRAAKAAKPA